MALASDRLGVVADTYGKRPALEAVVAEGMSGLLRPSADALTRGGMAR